MTSRVLILYAHPSSDRSEVNQRLFETAQGVEGVTCIDLYALYPRYQIDVESEQKRLLEHDIIIFQFPMYWYSTPSILKEWQDLVLEYGFAYGQEGNALRNKYFFCALSAGGSESAYRAQGYNHFTIEQLLQPLQQTANLTQMIYLPPFAIFGSRTALDEGRFEEHRLNWERLLIALRDEQFDFALAAKNNSMLGALDNAITQEQV